MPQISVFVIKAFIRNGGFRPQVSRGSKSVVFLMKVSLKTVDSGPKAQGLQINVFLNKDFIRNGRFRPQAARASSK